tara:strand:+ start:1350 stop:2957 length:1608 start_codon:yes stop_codon:yes gene_type:complete
MNQDNKKGLVALLLVLITLGIVSLVIWSASEIERNDKRVVLEKSLAILINKYVDNPNAGGLREISSWLDDYLLKAKNYGYSASDNAELTIVSKHISDQVSLLCSSKECLELEAKSSDYSEFVEDFQDASSSYASALKNADAEKVSMVWFVCPSLARESTDSYVFYCSANGSVRSYLAMYKSDYSSINASGSGLLINKALPVKDAGLKSTRIDGVGTIIQTYTLADMPKRPEILVKFSKHDFNEKKKDLAFINKALTGMVAENFIGAHNETIADIEGLAKFSGYKIKKQIRLLKSNISFVDDLLRRNYGDYSWINKCWKYHSEVNQADYCMSLLVKQEIVINGRKLVAVAVKGVGERRNVKGLVGLFLVDQSSGSYVAKNKEIISAYWGEPKLDNGSLELVGKDLYAWVLSGSYVEKGFKTSHTVIFPQLDETYSMALDFYSSSALDNEPNADTASVREVPICYDCIPKEYFFTTKLSFDAKSNASAYPLNIELSGELHGKKIETKASFIFDERSGKYYPQKPLDEYMAKLLPSLD